MRTLLNIALLSLTAAPALAQVPGADMTIPEPGVMGLVGIGVLAFLIARRKK